MRRLWLVRHATPLVAPGLCYGRLDVEADVADTERAASALHLILPCKGLFVSSPLRRCRQLARAIAKLRPEHAITHDRRLKEMDFGEWEGQPWAELGKPRLDAWTADFANHPPGGGETVAAFMDRVASAFDALPRGETVWITHAGVIRAASLLASGRRKITSANDWPHETTPFGSYLQLNLPE